ncbi:MAG: hypothetical protein R3E12_01865 [Candidatus Eisenbacteria bacterium]
MDRLDQRTMQHGGSNHARDRVPLQLQIAWPAVWRLLGTLGLVLLAAFAVPPRVACAEAVPDSLIVSYQDGRVPETIPVHRFPEGRYVALTDLGVLTGHGIVWDPETFRGSVQLDSTSVGFLLDAPLLWLGADVLQLSAPVIYREEQVMVPFDLIDDVLVPALGERSHYDASRGLLELGGGEPRLQHIEIAQVSRHLTLSMDPMPNNRMLRWDPSGILSVQIGGVFLPPGYRSPELTARGLDRVEVLGTKRGMEIRLHLVPGWVGARSFRTPEGRLQVEMTQVLRDVETGRFQLLTSYLVPERDGGGPFSAIGCSSRSLPSRPAPISIDSPPSSQTCWRISSGTRWCSCAIVATPGERAEAAAFRSYPGSRREIAGSASGSSPTAEPMLTISFS